MRATLFASSSAPLPITAHRLNFNAPSSAGAKVTLAAIQAGVG
jgi:hypothetical protein